MFWGNLLGRLTLVYREISFCNEVLLMMGKGDLWQACTPHVHFYKRNAPCPEGVSDSLTTYPHSVLTVGPSSIPLWPARTPLKTIIGGFPGGPVVKTSEHHGVLVWSLVRELRSHMQHDVAKKRKPKTPRMVTGTKRYHKCSSKMLPEGQRSAISEACWFHISS